MELALASGSPRRADLLRQIGVPFRLLTPPDIDEIPLASEKPLDYVRRLAADKARVGLESLAPVSDIAVMGADTTVVLDDRVLGKPRDADQALTMLLELSGRMHRVLSAVSITTGDEQRTLWAETKVEFEHLTEDMARRYLATGEPMDKAGAYGIQGMGAVLVTSISGSYSNVVGLPLAETRQLLEWAHVPYWRSEAGNPANP